MVVAFLLFYSSIAQAIMPAHQAHDKSLDKQPLVLRSQALNLLESVEESIKAAVDTGSFSTTISVYGYNNKAVDLVVAKLVHSGYNVKRVETFLEIGF